MRKPHWILRVKNRGHDVAERQCLANCVSLEHNTTHTLGLRLQIWRNQQEQKKKTERKSAGAEWKPIEIEAGVDIIALWGMLKNQNRVGRNAGCNNRERWAAKLKTSDGFQKQSSQIWKNDGGFARDGPTLSPVHVYRSFCWTLEDIPSITVIQFGWQIKWFEKFGLVTLKRVHSVKTNTLLSECLKKKWEHKKISTWVMFLANPLWLGKT